MQYETQYFLLRHDDVMIFLLRNHPSHIKGSSDPSHFIFEINVGKGRIRQRTTLKLNF